MNDNSLDGVAGLYDREQVLKEGTAYSFSHEVPTGSGYTYSGYKILPSGPLITGEYNLGTFTKAAFPNPVILNYYYDVDSTASPGEINLRHMVRAGPTGVYTLAKQQTVPIAALPSSASYGYDADYGNFIGSNLSYLSYSGTVTPKTSQSVTVNAATPKAYVSFFYEKPISFTGDFDVLPNTLPYKASFALHLKNFQLNGCIYQSHTFKIERGGTWTGSPVTSQTTDSTYTYGSYPWVIGVGIHNVYMQIVTSCGTSDWIGPKPLTVTGPTVNNPPTFSIGFVDPGQPTKPLHQVVEGTTLNLVYINDPTVPTPNDPDGDNLYFMGFDYSAGSPFVQSIPSKSIEYVDGQHNLTMDSLGFQNICGQMRDEWGATAKACTYIEVVPKNPVPVIDCPPSVIANHPIPAGAINGSRSYSPISYLKIDHSRDEWTNKKSSYPNPETTDITVQVSLSVYDENGLKSLDPATCTIIVQPDLPPVAKLVVPPLSVRGTQLDMLNKSTSPDGDAIVTAAYKYKYDANNNGFSDDAWKTVSGTLTKLQFTPTKVGKYLYYLKVTEEYGQWDDTDSDPPATLTLDVVNNAPEVSFEMEGNNPQPNLDPYTRITADDMLKWPTYVPGTNNLVNNINHLWRSSAGNLISGEGRNFGKQDSGVYEYSMTRWSDTKSQFDAFPLANNGYGNNELSPWRSTLKSDVVTNLLSDNNSIMQYYNGQKMPKIRSTKKLLFFDKNNDSQSYNYNNQTWTYSYDEKIYALDPAKLSPIVDVYGSSVTQKFQNGSPYAYILSNYDVGSKTIDSYKYGGFTYKDIYAYPRKINEYEIADQYLYVQRTWELPGNIGRDKTTGEFGIYDARTGAPLTSTFNSPTLAADIKAVTGSDNTDVLEGMTIYGTEGSSLILESADNFFAAPGQLYKTYYKLTRDLHFSKINSIYAPTAHTTKFADDYHNSASSIYYTTMGEMTDATGAMYRYEGWTSSGNSNWFAELSVAKYNADFTLAWRNYLGDGVSGQIASQVAPTANYSWNGAFVYPEGKTGFFFNPVTKELYAKYYYDYYKPYEMVPTTQEAVAVINSATGAIKRKVDSLAGDDLTLYHYGDSDYGFSGDPAFSTDFAGTIKNKGRLSTTIDGYQTSMNASEMACNSGFAGAYNQYGQNKVLDKNGTPAGTVGMGCNFSNPQYGQYFMDGVYVSLSQAYPLYNGKGQDQFRLTVSVGKPTTNAPVMRSFTSGQFYSPFSLSDAEMKFSFKMDDADYDDEWLGFSFRMKDRLNGYALETDAKKIELVKYVAGVRTVLATQNYTLNSQKTYAVKLQTSEGHIAVFLDNAPIMEVNDAAYTTGRFGYFTNKSFVTFSGVAYKPIVKNDVWSDQYAIWDEGSAAADVQYNNIVFSDPENDPAAGGVYDWTVKHALRFIHNQGVSALNGKTFKNAQLKFDKVGDYIVSLKAKDDPNPDYLSPSNTFDAYRKSSNEFTQKITVHRRPIAKFTLASDAQHKILWTDSSYDPDRYFSSTDYSTEATGIDYKTTKGILQKRFYYVTPSGVYKEEKLTAPQELGTYEVALAVKDEYGAWSEWYVVMLPVTDLAPPNNPPVPGFTADRVNTFRGVPITFNSTAYDVEDGDRTKLPHEYYVSNTSAGSTESFASNSRTNWTKSFSSMGTFNVRQTVSDADGATADFSLQVNIVNQKPKAVITAPASTDQANPTKLTVLRPDFQWNYSDADGDTQTQFQVKIYKYGGVLQYDSGVKTSSANDWIPGGDLPEKVNMYVIVRVFDGYDWSGNSDPHYFYIETNRPPTADFDWSPKPVYEGDTIKITQTIGDPDKDSLSVQYTVKDPNGAQTTYPYSLANPYPTNGPLFAAPLVGTYTVQLTVSDGKAPPVAVTKNIVVLPLSVSGLVKHTELWNERRRESNLKASGDAEHPRGYGVFWAGERFLLSASTTDTLTETDAVEVKVTLNGLTASLTPSGPSRASWSGELWDPEFEKLPDGPLTFAFKALYSNGTVKFATVKVVIAGNVQQTVGVHRRK
ncbi:hypothetical protein [Paenibacillus sacheonensis]|uniref:Uncharacterized protein n=1 Tax=Paenibacillus sacheonensis TaxID=742054 RepID=A0A7X4YSF7_9BACL|nr:hypothetical protein [Paenibacillus sacheonensis]MBM7566728.1 hypothetical protein [Paenibacillus sacheonensis]NBC71696.1 hypothetical protein [Paenibacillus sacheonensis]